MQTLILTLCVLAAPVSAAAGPSDNPPVQLFVESSSRPTPLQISKAKLVKTRTTLGELVNTLGPGWTSPYESVGIVRWFFADGRVLSAWPRSYEESEIVLLKDTHDRGQMWWGRS